MGKRGPKPESPTLKLVNGSRRPNLSGKTPNPERGIPAMPFWLSPSAKNEWRRVTKDLMGEGMLARIDRAALVGYCQSHAEVQEATAILNKEGRIVTLPNGIRTAHPAIKLQRSALSALEKFSRELGLTPASRERLTMPEIEEKDVDPLDELMDRNNDRQKQA